MRRAEHPAKGGRSFQTAIVQTEAVSVHGTFTGLEEIRASEQRCRESLTSACDFVRNCDRVLIGRELPLPREPIYVSLRSL